MTDNKRLAVRAKLLQLANSETMESADIDTHSKNGSGADSPTLSGHQLPNVKGLLLTYCLVKKMTKQIEIARIMKSKSASILQRNQAPRDYYPLKWWKQNEFRFQCLEKNCQIHPVCSSTASERLFSTAGLTA